MARRNQQPQVRPTRISDFEVWGHLILGCQSKGVGLSPAMRLVSLTMLLWEDHWERMSMDYEAISDRTGLDVSVVKRTMDKLEAIRMVEAMADGWRLTLQRWREGILRV